MNLPKVTQENVHIFIPLKVARISERYAKNHKISKKEAMLDFYNSELYDVLEKEDTKLWYEGVNFLYEELEIEKNSDTI